MASSDTLRDALSSNDLRQESTSSSSSGRGKRVRPQPRVRLTTNKLTTNLQIEANHDAFQHIRRLLELFHAHSIPGPLLVRTRSDFSLEVGSGGQGQVRAASKDYISALDNLTPMPVEQGSIWPNNGAQDRCISLWQSCVIKQLRSKNRKLESEAASAVREVYSLCQASKSTVRSKHIVKLLGWGICLDALESKELSNSKLPFLVLERAECDMEQFISEGRHETEDTPSKMRIALNIGKGLFAIHTANMAHGDMKLSNILMFLDRDRSWSVKICDFGSASDGDHFKMTGQYSGTDTWRPPESFYHRGALDLKLCDIFAYGLVTWSWLLGRDTSPIDHLESNQILKARGKQQYYRLALENIVAKYGEASDRKWLGKYREDCRHHPRVEDTSRVKRSRHCGLCFSNPPSQLTDIPTRDFKSIVVKRILNMFAGALDEVPSRRSGQPWNCLDQNISVRAPVPPKPYERRQDQRRTRGFDQPEQDDGSSAEFRALGRLVIAASKSLLGRLTDSIVFQCQHWLFVLTGGNSRLSVFRHFHRNFYDVLGSNFNEIAFVKHDAHERCVRLSESNTTSLRRLIRRNHSGTFWERCSYVLSSMFSDNGELSPPNQWSEDTLYALARLRSRFADEGCWQELFALDPNLRYRIDQAVYHLRLCSSQRAAAWAFRNITASDIPDADHLACFDFLEDASLSDKERTFRMHLLLEKGFFLGQKYHDKFGSCTVFCYYLMTLKDDKLALSICQHFRRIASLDGIRDSSKYYYTGLSDTTIHREDQEQLDTCLHDAVRALNLSVVGYLLKTDFQTNALDSDGRTAFDLLTKEESLEQKLSHTSQVYDRRRARLEIRAMFMRHKAFESPKDDLPQGWQVWPTTPSPAFVETSIRLEPGVDPSDPDGHLCPYPITFKKPLTGFYQSNVIALVARQISETEKEPYLFNPLRFLRLQNQIDTGLGPADTAYFGEDWYKSDVVTLHQAPEKETRPHETWRFLRPAFWSRFFTTLLPPAAEETYTSNWVGDRQWYDDEVYENDPPTRGTINEWSLITFLSGGLLLLVFVPLSMFARFAKWSPYAQFWMSTFGLAGIYAQLWYALDNSRICKPLGFAMISELSSTLGLKIGNVELDHLHIFAVLLLDLMVALFFSFNSSSSQSLAFIVGSITYSNILVFGVTACVMGLKYRQTLFDETAAQTLSNVSSFLVFIVVFVLTVKTHEPVPGETTAHWLTISRVAALFSIALAGWLYLFTVKTHREVFEYDEELRELMTGREIRTFRRAQPPLLGTAYVCVALFVLGALLSEILTTSMRELSPDDDHVDIFGSPWFAGFAPLVIVPCTTKIVISLEVLAFGIVGRYRSTLMRSMGVSVGHGLFVLPVLIIAGWCWGRDVGYAMSPWHAVFVFLQWQLIGRFVWQGWSAWFTGVLSIGFYSMFVLCAWVIPLD